MITNWPANLHDLGKVIYDAFLLPGDFVLTQFVAYAPTLALRLGIGGEGDGLMLPAVLSLLAWLLLVVVAWKFVRLLQNVARIVNAAMLSHFVRYTQREDKAGLHIAATDPAARIEQGRHDSRSAVG
jgi:hypothetical protein